MGSSSTTVRRLVNAPRAAVYGALLDKEAVRRWMVPEGMTSEVHEFEPWVGGRIRVSLTYEEQAGPGTGKTTAHTDTYHGTFVELVPDERMVEVIEFESDDPAIQGENRITISLADAADGSGGTEVVAVHAGLPEGVKPEDNEVGWESSLGRLSALVEGR